jgi:hypothetical protein
MKIALWTPKVRPCVSLHRSIPEFSTDLVFIHFRFKMSNILLKQRTSDSERQVIFPFLHEKEVEKGENLNQLIT